VSHRLHRVLPAAGPASRRFGVASALGAVLLLSTNAAGQTLTADDLFDDTVVHEIRLSVHPRDWASLRENFQVDDYHPAHFVWNGQTRRNVAIRSRGFGSRSPLKPGLRIDFDRYDRTQTLLGLTSVVLRNNTQDPSGLHERLSMKLFAQIGVPASRTAHARLFVNDEYAGLYLIVESIDRSFLDRQFAENDGYLYSYQWTAPYYFEFRGADPALYSPVPFEPETHVRDHDPAPLVDMIRAINETPPENLVATVGPRMDLVAFVRQAAIENFLGDNDGLLGYAGLNNFYLYRFRSNGVSTFIPWDKSEAFKMGPLYPIVTNITDVPESARNRLMDRAMAVPELRDLYFDTLLACAAIARTDAWLEREILREYDQIRQAALDDPMKPFTNDEFENDVLLLLEFARTRSEFVVADVARTR
jgi:spore coat protein H